MFNYNCSLGIKVRLQRGCFSVSWCGTAGRGSFEDLVWAVWHFANPRKQGGGLGRSLPGRLQLYILFLLLTCAQPLLYLVFVANLCPAFAGCSSGLRQCATPCSHWWWLGSGSKKTMVFTSEFGVQISVTCLAVACAQVVKQQSISGTQKVVWGSFSGTGAALGCLKSLYHSSYSVGGWSRTYLHLWT